MKNRPRLAAAFLLAAWALFGLFGRDPWKPDEAYTFGLVHHVAATGDWVVPTLAGQPFMEKPPLFFVTAAGFVKAFGGFLSGPDAARLASALYVALTLACAALTAARLYGGLAGAACALMLAGSLGYLHAAHLLITDNALVAGIAIALYGLAVALAHPYKGALLLGLGAGIAFLSKGLLGPGVLGVTALALGFLPAWRSPSYRRALGLAALVAAPFVLVWPILLYRRSPALFDEWLFVNNFGRFLGTAHLGPEQDHLMYLKILPWFAFPVLPLLAWHLYREAAAGRHPWRSPAVQLPGVAALVTLAVLSFSGSERNLYALPLLVPLALLASAATGQWSARLERWVHRGSLALGALAGAALWGGWFALESGWPRGAAAFLEASRPGFVPHAAPLAALLAVAVTVFWIALMRGAKNALSLPLHWAATVLLVWGLLTTLWLPYLDYGNSYRGMIARLDTHLPAHTTCVASRELGEPERALLEYFAGIVTQQEASAAARGCNALLVQSGGSAIEPRHGAGWHLAWSGARPGDAHERFWLFRRSGEAIAAAGRTGAAGPRHDTGSIEAGD